LHILGIVLADVSEYPVYQISRYQIFGTTASIIKSKTSRQTLKHSERVVVYKTPLLTIASNSFNGL